MGDRQGEESKSQRPNKNKNSKHNTTKLEEKDKVSILNFGSILSVKAALPICPLRTLLQLAVCEAGSWLEENPPVLAYKTRQF